jgi:hypothetical protein
MTSASQQPAPPRFDLFKVADGAKTLVCRDLNGDQALCFASKFKRPVRSQIRRIRQVT